MKKIKLCIIGAGRWGKNHIRTANECGVLAGVIDGNSQTLNDIRSNYPDIQYFNDLNEAGAMDFDAYIIAVPAEHHYSVGKQLILANKHVLIEKPITINIDEADELVQLAHQHNVVACVGHLLLFHNAFLEMKSLIHSGKIGKLQYMYSNRLNLGTVRKEENSLWSFAPHDISLFQFFTESFPESVSCSGGAFLQSHNHDTTLTSLAYPNNIKGHIFVSWLHPFKEHRFVAVGSKGMFTYEDSTSEKQLLFYEKGIDWVNGEPIKRDGPTEVIEYEKYPPLKAQLEHFIHCVNNRQLESKNSAEAGSDVLEILSMAQQSLDTGEIIKKNNVKKMDYYIHETAIVDEPCNIGENTKIWHYSHVQKNATIGKNCILGQNVNIGCNVTVGNYVKVQNNVSLYEGVELGDYVFCGPSMVFTNIKNPRSKYPQAESKHYIKTIVKEGVSFGANCTVVCGVTIGRFAFIGAGAVVTKDVPDFAMIVGNPGKIVGWMSEAGTKLLFNSENIAFCEKSKKSYQLNNGIVTEQSQSVKV